MAGVSILAFPWFLLKTRRAVCA